MAHEGIRDLVLNRIGEAPAEAPVRDRSFEDQVMAMERFKEALFEDEGISKAVRALDSFIRITMKKAETDNRG